MKILFYGAAGWIGSKLFDLLKKKGHTVIPAKARLENCVEVQNELEKNKNVTHVFMAAGLTSGTGQNIDWCEELQNKRSVISVNVLGTVMVAKFCYEHQIHFTFLGTGCIYEYDQDHPQPKSGSSEEIKGFSEEDEPNYFGSYYSETKVWIQKMLKDYNALILRIRMPISSEIHPRNLILKLIGFKYVINVPNSMTILEDFLPLFSEMMENKLVGVYNTTSPGTISHHQLLDLYKEYINPNFSYKSFTLEEQSKILKAGRSNNCLDTTKIRKLFPNLPDIQTSIVDVFKRMQENMKKDKLKSED